MADNNTTGMDSEFDIGLLRQSPFGVLLDIDGVDPETIFGNVDGSGGENPFGECSEAPSDIDTAELPYGGNPFAGDNFWNIFAGGVNPTEAASGGGNGGMGENPMGSGGFGGVMNDEPIDFGDGIGDGEPLDNSGGIPMGNGGGMGGENPFAGGGMGGENPFAGGGMGGGNPFAGGGMGGGNPFAGGGMGGGNPFAGGGMGGGNPFAGGGMPFGA